MISLSGIAALLVLSLAPLCAQAQAARPGPDVSAELAALVKAAQAERELVVYTAVPENVAKRVSDGFAAKSGLTARYVRLTGNALIQRFSSEAESGSFPADFIFLSGSATGFAEQAIKKGWLEPVGQSGLPVLRSGEFPAKFVTGPTAIVQVTPWLFSYNTEKVKGADVPKTWADLGNPKWKGQFLLPDPKTSDAYYAIWAMLLDKYGESYFTQLRAHAMRTYAGATVAAQALAAGEGSVTAPTTMAIIRTVKDRGGPIETVTPELTTGLEMHVLLSARNKSKHPNAARLFLNYVMSPDGNKLFNDDPGNNSVYDTASLPKQYQSPAANAIEQKDRILKLLRSTNIVPTELQRRGFVWPTGDLDGGLNAWKKLYPAEDFDLAPPDNETRHPHVPVCLYFGPRYRGHPCVDCERAVRDPMVLAHRHQLLNQCRTFGSRCAGRCQPAVADPRCAPQGGRADTPNDDGHVNRGIDQAQGLELEVLAMMLDVSATQYLAKYFQAFVKALSALLEWNTECVVLLLGPAGRHAHEEAIARQDLERRSRARGNKGMPQREEIDACCNQQA